MEAEEPEGSSRNLTFFLAAFDSGNFVIVWRVQRQKSIHLSSISEAPKQSFFIKSCERRFDENYIKNVFNNFSTFSFHQHFLIAIFRFGTILDVMETQR